MNILELPGHKLVDHKGVVGLYRYEYVGMDIADTYSIIDMKRQYTLFVGDKDDTMKVWRTFDPNNRESRTRDYAKKQPCLYRQGLTRNPLRILGKK